MTSLHQSSVPADDVIAAEEPANGPETVVLPGDRLLPAVWWLWAVLLGGGLVAETAGLATLSAFGRLSSSVVLVLAGWIAYRTCRTTVSRRFTGRIAAGMTLGALGDFFMAGLLSAVPLPSPVLGGMAAFGLGHVLYIGACRAACRRLSPFSAAAMWGSVLVWQMVSVAGWYVVVFLSTDPGTRMLVWPALPYSQLLAGTAGVAAGLAVQDRPFRMLAVGAALFLISDLVLAWGMFRGPLPFRTQAVWIPYGLGQMMIVYGGIAARKAFSDNPQLS